MAQARPVGILTLALIALIHTTNAQTIHGWLSWRGPNQSGTSSETGLVDTWELGGKNDLWQYPVSGRGTPVIAGDRVYVFAYDGEGPNLREHLLCLDAKDAKLIWKHSFSDFISDIIYNRYAIGSPAIDPDTGNVYLMTSPGLFVCFSADGELKWQHSLMESHGRLSFPNGRTGAPVVDGDLVIVRGITTNWGRQGPARDRFYAFDKRSGAQVWASTPGVRPSDSSFSTPVFAWQGNRRVFYAGTGCGNIVCANARTGQPLWRFQLLNGGINSSVLLHKDNVIAIHGKENLDSSEIGRMVSVHVKNLAAPTAKSPTVATTADERWRTHLAMFTSSPVLAGGRIYQVDHTGVLSAVDADSGNVRWQHKLGTAQLHASPLFADGKLYVPIKDGHFYILEVTDDGAKELCKVKLEGNCLGSPAIANGRIYVHSTKKLYCFGIPKTVKASWPMPKKVQPAPPSALQIVPNELLLVPGDKVAFKVNRVDVNGHVIDSIPPETVKWERFIPPTAKVRAEMNAQVNAAGVLEAAPQQLPSAGAFRATADGLTDFIRGRVLPAPPLHENFESFELQPHKSESGVRFAYPPLPWIGARFKWEIRELEGNKVLAKTLERVLFQRCTTFFGHPSLRNYTLSADVRTDGNRRIKSTVGLVNQRYLITLKGNWQQLEITSNHERIKQSVPFKFRPKKWYRLKTRVDVAADGSGVVRAKAWPRDSEEPAAWLLEVPHDLAHQNGAPGLFGFSPQSKFRVYIDNVSVTHND